MMDVCGLWLQCTACALMTSCAEAGTARAAWPWVPWRARRGGAAYPYPARRVYCTL